MNHPKPEEWIPYLYREAPAQARRELAAHLRECAQCREEIDTWKRSLNHLDAWKAPRPRRQYQELLSPFLKWATTAAVMLAAGILIGRATTPKVDVEKLRQAIAPQIQQDLDRELTEVVRREVARAGALAVYSSHKYTDQVAQQLYGRLKKDVDTIAMNADAGLRYTAEQLVQLADYKQPATSTPPNQ